MGGKIGAPLYGYYWIQLIDPHPELEFTLETMRLAALGGHVLCNNPQHTSSIMTVFDGSARPLNHG